MSVEIDVKYECTLIGCSAYGVSICHNTTVAAMFHGCILIMQNGDYLHNDYSCYDPNLWPSIDGGCAEWVHALYEYDSFVEFEDHTSCDDHSVNALNFDDFKSELNDLVDYCNEGARKHWSDMGLTDDHDDYTQNETTGIFELK